MSQQMCQLRSGHGENPKGDAVSFPSCFHPMLVYRAGNPRDEFRSLLMKTFRELIAWELEQERKGKRPVLDTANGASKLTDTVVRKLRYLNSNVSSGDREIPHNFGTA
jgi:hypothetical protein